MAAIKGNDRVKGAKGAEGVPGVSSAAFGLFRFRTQPCPDTLHGGLGNYHIIAGLAQKVVKAGATSGAGGGGKCGVWRRVGRG